jgi:hypothetical protein
VNWGAWGSIIVVVLLAAIAAGVRFGQLEQGHEDLAAQQEILRQDIQGLENYIRDRFWGQDP